MAQQLIELAMPDGQMVWAMVERQGPRDTGLGDQVVQRIEGFQESLHALAANVRTAVATARPDEVGIEFGLELAAGKHGVVAALTGVGGKATFKVTLKWTATGPDLVQPQQPDPVVVPAPSDEA
ncbi:CU044_2847 family protein [Streptomyces sp. NPDC007905]|uniref:CU044_2847 family protein n=1 Tax=Streptomyces sp. NPDC007905 TaxID=3364788 RepID=UPI0036E6813A